MGCTISAVNKSPAPIGYDVPMETVLHTTELSCPPTIVSNVGASDKVVRVVGRIESCRGKDARQLWSYISGKQSVMVDLELIVETNYMVAVERDGPMPDDFDRIGFTDSDEDDDDEDGDSILDLLDKHLAAVENTPAVAQTGTCFAEANTNATIDTINKPKPITTEGITTAIAAATATIITTTTWDTCTTTLDATTRPSSQSQLPINLDKFLSSRPTNETASATRSNNNTTSISTTTTTTTTTTTLPNTISNSTIAPTPNLTPVKVIPKEHHQQIDHIQEQVYEFIPGFDAWSDGLKERVDFWITQGGKRIFVPMQSRNISILTDLRRTREMYGDPEICGRKKRQHREEDYYLGCNKIIGGALSKNGASRVDFEAAKWIQSSRHPDDFPEKLRDRINTDYSDVSNEYFQGASYGFREAGLNVGETVHILGVVKEQINSKTHEKYLVLHPFTAKDLLLQTSLTSDSGTNPILRNLLAEDFREISSRLVVSRADDDGNPWSLHEYESSRPGFPLRDREGETKNCEGECKNSTSGMNIITKVVPATT